MALLIYVLTYFLFIDGLKPTSADHRHLQLIRKSTSGNLFGLGCAIEQYEQFHSTGARFDPVTRACESLNESWFTNPIQESGFTYFTVLMKEDVFPPTPNALIKIPNVTVTEFSVVLFFNSGYDLSTWRPGFNSQIRIEFQETDQLTIGFLANIATYLQVINFNSFISGSWVIDLQRPITITNQNTIYKFEAKINSINIQVYIDDVHVMDYPHLTAISNYQMVNAIAKNGAKILKVQYYYPG